MTVITHEDRPHLNYITQMTVITHEDRPHLNYITEMTVITHEDRPHLNYITEPAEDQRKYLYVATMPIFRHLQNSAPVHIS